MESVFSARGQSREILWLTIVAVLFCAACPGPAEPPPQPLSADRPLQKAQIFGKDDRTAVPDTSIYPWSAVGRVLSFYPTEIHAGTGAMIGNNIVLTAAHVVFDQNLGAPDSIQFIPGLNGSAEPFGTVNVTDTAIPQQWMSNGDENFDIAVLTVDSSVGGQTGILPFDVVPASTLTGKILQSAGYPSDLKNGESMYAAPGMFLGIDGNMLRELIDTEPGQSGSPIWLQDGGNITLVAVIVGTRQSTDMAGQTVVEGIGTYISQEIFTWINDAIAGNVNPTTPGNTLIPGLQCGTCGAGTGQAILLISLGWTGCFFSRRGRRI